MKYFVHTAVAACMVVSCASRAAAQMPSFSPADSKELAAYRLTMDTARKAQVMMRSLFEEMSKDPKVKALMKTEAEIDALEKKDELTDAESERLEKLRELKEQQEEAAGDGGLSMNKASTLDEMEAELKKSPPAMAALAKAGLAPREYSKFMVMSLMAGMVAGFQKSGMLKELPKELKEIHPDNIKFMIDHEAEFAEMRKEMEKLGKGGS